MFRYILAYARKSGVRIEENILLLRVLKDPLHVGLLKAGSLGPIILTFLSTGSVKA